MTALGFFTRTKWQYYYKQNHCKATSAQEPDCICWHFEGKGPYPEERYSRYSTKYWRKKLE